MQPRQCKFGVNCRNLANGIPCKFYHPPGQQPTNQPNVNTGTGPFGYPPRPNPNPRPTGPYPTNTGSNNTGPYNGPKTFKNDQGDVSYQLCRNFHLGIECKHGEKCNRKHAFLINNPESLRRFQMIRTLPQHPVSKLTKFNSGGKDYFAMRNDKTVNIFQFSMETKEFKDVYTWQFPDPNGKFSFYGQKDQFIYFARENPDMHFQDLGFFSLQTQKNCFVQNGHRTKITGIVHFNQNVVLSTSMEGELKVWMVEGQKLQSRIQETEKLRSLYNPHNAKIEIYFLDISEVNGMKITSMGTSDGRIVFFIGDAMDYKYVAFGYIESKVFEVRYSNRHGAVTALVLTWNDARNHSAILQIDLSNGFQIRPLVQLTTTSDQPKNTIHLFELVHGFLMVSTLSGFVSIYNYPDVTGKIGGIHFQNSITQNIIQSCDQLKNTHLKVKTMLILQKRTQKNDGSLQIYHFQ